MEKYLEGNTYTIDGKKQIYQVDGTFRDASIVAPPKPVDYVELPKRTLTPAETAALDKASGNISAGTPGAASAGNAGDVKNVQYAKDNLGYKEPASAGNFKDGTGIAGYDAALAKEKEDAATAEWLRASGQVKYNGDGTRVLTGAEKEIADYYATHQPKTQAEIDAENEAIRQADLKRQQDEINGINTIYDNLLGQINKDNEGRVGSAASIGALSGQRGSASGAADMDATVRSNQKVVEASNAERQAKINVILSNHKTSVDNEIAKATELRKNDANAWLTYKAGEVDRNKSQASELRKQFLAANMKPEDIDDDTYKKIADSGGYTLEQAKALYKSEFESQHTAFVNSETERLTKLEKTKAETEKLKADASSKSEQAQYIKKGYKYLSTMDEVAAAERAGQIVSKQGGSYYVVPSTTKTKVITRGSNNVLIDSTTGEDIKDLGPAKTKTGGGGSSKNYTAVTIPSNVKKDLLYDKAQGGKQDELMNAYPDVSTSYIQSLFADPAKLAF